MSCLVDTPGADGLNSVASRAPSLGTVSSEFVGSAVRKGVSFVEERAKRDSEYSEHERGDGVVAPTAGGAPTTLGRSEDAFVSARAAPAGAEQAGESVGHPKEAMAQEAEKKGTCATEKFDGRGGAASRLQVPPSQEELRAAAAARGKPPIEEESDTEPDAEAWPKGSGLVGRGPMLEVGSGPKRRPLQDGGGLCSPGRWPPRHRPRAEHPVLRDLRAAILRAIQRLPSFTGIDNRELYMRMAAGKLAEEPWPEELTDSLRSYVEKRFQEQGEGDSGLPRPGDRKQQIRTRLVQALLRVSGDPDAAGMDALSVGVPIGVGVRLPRTPALYARKRRWRLPQQYATDAWEQPTTLDCWRDNYKSTFPHVDEIARQLDELAANDQTWILTENQVKQKWPGACIASLGALEKVEADGTVKVRLLFDGTTEVGINERIRVRDQDRGPGAPDIKRVQRAQAEEKFPTWGITIDIKDAHRTIQVREQDWRYQLCRASPAHPIHAHKCGVFGIASISYWWSRAASALLRLVYYLADEDMAPWVLLVADDYKVESTGKEPHVTILFVLILFRLLGAPVQWRKLKGGRELNWVGYNLLLSSHQLGLSQARADWVVAWCDRLVRDRAARIGELREGLGRLAFVAGALLYERPFLSPLFSFLSWYPDSALKPLPVYVLLVLKHLGERIKRRRHYPSAVKRSALKLGPRVDAKAEGSQIGVGGWLPQLGAGGEIDKSASRWFSLELDRESAPWAYLRDGQPFRVIAALEAYGVLIAAKVFLQEIPEQADVLLMPTQFTDNQGNSSALTRLTSTKYPLCCVAMELSATLESRGVQLELEWTPRDWNSEADALSNGDTTGFLPENRVDVDPRTLRWEVMDELMRHGANFTKDYQRLAARPRIPAAAKKRRQQRLRAREPW